MSGFHPKRTLALPIAPTETDAVSIADETGLAAVVSQVPECLLSAFLVVIDATNDQSPHGLVSERGIRLLGEKVVPALKGLSSSGRRDR